MENWATKEALLGQKVPREKHRIDGVGDVWIYGLTVGQKDEYEDAVFNVKAGSREVRVSNARALLIVRTLRNQHGKALFGDADMGRVRDLPAQIAEPIFAKAQELSGMPKGEVSEMVKNSEAIAELDSSTE